MVGVKEVRWNTIEASLRLLYERLVMLEINQRDDFYKSKDDRVDGEQPGGRS